LDKTALHPRDAGFGGQDDQYSLSGRVLSRLLKPARRG